MFCGDARAGVPLRVLRGQTLAAQEPSTQANSTQAPRTDSGPTTGGADPAVDVRAQGMSAEPAAPAAPSAPEGDSGGEPALPPAAVDGPESQGTSDDSDAALRRRILIGSQRDPAAYRARRQRDWEPVADTEDAAGPQAEGTEGKPSGQPGGAGREEGRRRNRRGKRHGPPHGMRDKPAQPASRGASVPACSGTSEDAYATEATDRQSVPPPPPQPPASTHPGRKHEEEAAIAADLMSAIQAVVPPAAPAESLAPPSRRDRLSPDLEEELDRAMGGIALDDLMAATGTSGSESVLEPESHHAGKVVAVRRDDVFLELGGREQGCIPLRQFATPPTPGTIFDVVVQRFNAEEGLYDLRLPDSAVELGNWDDVHEGMLVEASVTGHNTGGLECDVNHIRGFIPASQIALYRVEDLAQFVGQRMSCLITEANPERRNLVLSRRAVLEQEKEEARQKMFDALAPGQVHQGVVRKILDFGAFVDIGGIDGLLHVSQLSWGRINHPSEVLAEGQSIQVRIERIDRETGKIGFSYRELLENPWTTAATKFAPNSIVRGKVTKLMEFGAFVELERGVEGLVHISELSPKRVWRTSDVVHEGDEIEVMVLSVNTEAQRISLSMKALAKPDPEEEKKKIKEQEAGQAPPAGPKKKHRSEETLGGGIGRTKGGDRFGLKW